MTVTGITKRRVTSVTTCKRVGDQIYPPPWSEIIDSTVRADYLGSSQTVSHMPIQNSKKRPPPPPKKSDAIASGDAVPKQTKTPSHEAIWGKPVVRLGYAAVPSIFLQTQQRLGLSNTQAMICIHLLDYWHFEERRPFPSKKDLSRRMGVTEKTIQTNIAAMEKAGLIRRELRFTASGDHNSNVYHLDGLVSKVRALEPEFTADRLEQKANREKLQSRGGKNPKKAAG